MIDAVHLPGHVAVLIIATAVIMDIRLFAGPAIQTTDRRRQQFTLVFGVDRARQLAPDLVQLRVAVADRCLGEAAVAMADRHRLVGRRQAAAEQEQCAQEGPDHQS